MKAILKSISDRLREPSTHATITTALIGVGVSVESSIISGASLILAGITGLLGVFLKEGDKE